MRLSDATVLWVTGLAAATVLAASAAGLFADPPAAVTGALVQRHADLPAAPVSAAPSAPPQLPAAAADVAPAALATSAPAAAVQREWQLPEQTELKVARPPPGGDELPRPAPVYAPGEQQAAWAARDQLANAGRAARSPPPASLTRPHEGAAPDKAAAGL